MSLFQDQNTSPQGDSNQTQTENGTSYENLVGEGKKYRDNEALANSKIESDRFIETLKREAREKEAEITRLHKELNARISLEEAVNKINVSPSNNALNSNQSPTSDGEQNVGGSAKSGLSAEDAERLFEKKLLQTQQELVANQNLRTVDDELSKAWGADKDIKLRTKARELGLTEGQVDGIAKNNPKAFLAMFGLLQETVQRSVQVTPPRSQTEGSVPKITPGVKNQAYWDAMRKSNPTLYFSQAMTVERHRSAVDLQDNYFN